MDRRGSFDDSLNDQAIPIPIQIFLWRQTSPFIRPKLGKLHESSCLFCQNAPGHHELKEACKSFEKVLVQNIQFGLSPSLTEAIRSIPRWRLVQASFPHVMHCAAALLGSRRDNNLQNLSAAETKLLYTLHWIILDAAEECANDDFEKDIFHSSPFYYLFSIPSITVFIFLFAPLCHHLKESDMQSFRLENGLKLWQAIWEYKHPDARCFTAHCKPKPRTLSARGRNFPQARGLSTGDFFPGAKRVSSEDAAYQCAESPPSASLSDPANGLARSAESRGSGDDESAWMSSPKEPNFPETIPEESSSTEEEHMVIFKLPSLSDSEGLKESSIYSADASIFQVPVGRNSSSSPRGILNIEQVTAISGSDTRQYRPRLPQLRTDVESTLAPPGSTPVTVQRQKADLTAATFMDVAVLRCLFLKNWQEEGVYWALQFLYHRLREISDETATQQLPRRRSNSLPIPKIEVSIYQSPELKKRESRVFIDVPDDSSLIGKKQTLASSDGEQVGGATGTHSRSSSQKVKKRMKMADLKAFVETKLLSKSEKTLEKIGQDDTKAVFDQNRSLDAGDEHQRPCSALAKMLDPHKTDTDHIVKPVSNLVKGKSMPSLSCLIDELASAGYIGEACGDRGRQQRPAPLQLQPVPHPIITVTEHTPTPSPDYLSRRPEHGSIDSQLDALSLQGSRSGGVPERKPSLTRSQTDSNITYTKDEVLEAPGSVCYITKDGDIDYQVVVKAVHSVAVRDNTCTLRVCEVILNLVELLMELGVLKVPPSNHEQQPQPSTSKAENSTPGRSTPGPSSSQQQQSTSRGPEDVEHAGMEDPKSEIEVSSAHGKLINCVVRVVKQLGCPQGCGDGARGPPADFLRSQSQTLLSKLHRVGQKPFSRYFRTYVRRKPIMEVLDFFHAFLGFCVDPGSLLSPLNQKRSASKSPDIGTGPSGGYATNFGAGLGGGGSRGIEGHIVACVFKNLISRLIHLRDLKNQENINLYCDVRQLVTYVREAHGGTFRRVVLSALLDSSSRPHKKEPSTQTTRVIRTSSQIHIHADSAVSLLETETTGDELPTKTSSQSPLGTLRGGRSGGKQYPPHLHVLTPRHSERTLGIDTSASSTMPSGKTPRKTSSRFLGGWFKKDGTGRTESTDSHDGSDSPIESSFMRQPSMYYLHGRGSAQKQAAMGSVGQTFQKARRKMEDQLNKIGLGKGKKKDGGLEETPGGHFSRRNSMETGEHAGESEFVVLKERKLVPLLPVFNGTLRFQFLLDTCHPGSVPDPHLLSAVLDMPHAPVVAKASLLLECAYFVHSCNKGQWPAWMKLNIPMFRPSVPLSSRSAPSGLRRSHMLQRAAGKMFYQWAEALGSRLEEMIGQDKQHVTNVVTMITDETRQKELLLEDEEEDFLDEASIGLMGLQCPIALRMVACLLLLEITTFLRETYQALPKCTRLSSRDRPPAWERMYSRAGPGAMPTGAPGAPGGDANRRWSMALSSMGHSQTSAQSLQSIAGDKDNGAERKISFVLHEPDNESEGSSNTTVTVQGEEAQARERERVAAATATTPVVATAAAPGSSRAPPPRPFLLRRGTNAGTTGSAGSFKRRSLKLRRNTKDATSIRSENESTETAPVGPVAPGTTSGTVRRTDSIQSKRKVSSLSDRSDTSDHGEHAGGGGGDAGSGGEESPGVLSDEQPPESPSDSNDTDEGCITKNLPWMKTVVLLANSFNFYCEHQGFCHPFCYRRHMRACSRLIKSVRKVYGEQFGVAGDPRNSDRERTLLRDEQGGAGKKDKGARGGRKVSDQASSQTSPIRRKDSLGKKDRLDSKLVRDSSRDIAEGDCDISGSGQHPANAEGKDAPPMLKYIKAQVKNVFHAPLSVLVKGAVVLSEDHFIDILPVAWELLLEPGQEVAAAAATLFILAAVKAPSHASDVMHQGLQHADTSTRINAILRFQVLWKFRYQVWPRMEEGAYLIFKVPPPGIEFTLPSPKIGIESLPVVDPPWMPQVKTKVEEVTISQESHRSLVTATKTRKKQQTELIKLALQAEEDKKRQEREDFLITTIPITFQAAYEPSLYHAAGEDHDDGDEEQAETQMRGHMVHAAHSLFPSCLCSAVIQIINLLDDAAVTPEGSAVYEVAYQVIWTCLVEDSALFLRYILERLTRERQDLMFKILRHLIRFVPKLPQQAAFALYNYIIGYIMFYVRTPHEDGQTYIGTALSILWMVVHSVHGIMFKDLKQILRKEQCDASILLTANVPSAKKIIVHGPQEPDVGGIPSQFPVQEDTQFCQILRESLDFFGIDENRHKEFFLVDHKTHQIHNPSAYVRDFYFFKRSQYPQLQLVHMQPEEAYNALQKSALTLKFVEIGKVMLTWAILKNVDMVVQRVVFLHEELMKLPSFPRKALESDLDLYKGGELGKELLGLDMMHKFMWVRLIARMFEAMAGNFAYSGDIHLFLNVLNGSLILHSEDACLLRYVTATYINAASHFKNIFSTNGYLLIMPTLLQIYSNHQTNKLVTRTVEYTVKQFYLLNRKPFILQMFGSVSAILDTDEDSQFGDAHKVQPNCLFNLLLSLETPSPDPLNIGELVREEKPLRPIDFCYRDENEMVTVLDCISLCVMVVAYSADSLRGQQMLTILEAILPCYLQHIQQPWYRQNGKCERDIIAQLAVAIKTLVNNCEALSKNYTGPQKASPDHKGSSQRNYRSGPYSPGFEFDEDSHSKYMSDHSRTKATNDKDLEDSEVLRNEFRRPRDILLSMVADFLTKCTTRLAELSKRAPQDGKPIEMLDAKAHVRLSDIAHSLLKVSPYDPDTMGCRGLQRYMNELLPSTEWANEAMRPALTAILRRLDKTFNKIYKKPSIRRHTDWDAAAGLLKGIYETLSRYPYIVHMQHLKTLMNTCQALIVGDAVSTGVVEGVSSATAALMSQVPPPHFCSTIVRLIALQILAIGETYSLEQVCGGSSVFPTHAKTETMLMNLLMPLCLRVGSGRKDMPRMRQADISFALTVVLHAVNPPATKTSPVTAQNIKTASEMRAGSVTYGSRDASKRAQAIPQSLYRTAFLALRIMIVAFERELVMDWHRIARTIQEMGRRDEGGILFWEFLDFVVTQRSPLFILLTPFISQNMLRNLPSEQEREIQSLIRDKMRCINITVRKAKGALLLELAHEMKELKEEMEDRKFEEADRKMAEEQQPMHRHRPSVHHRPSIIELFTGGDLGRHSALTVDTAAATLAPPQSILHRASDPGSATESGSTCTGVIVEQPSAEQELLVAAAPESCETTEEAAAVSEQQQQQESPSRVQSPTTDRLHNSRPKASKLRFVPSVEFRHSSGETSITPLSPGSPGGEDSGGEQGRSKPRLQRSKAQSRKTFRLRKSRKSKIEVSHIKVDPPPPLDIVTSEAPQISGAPLELSVTATLTPPSSASSLPPPCSPLSIHGRGGSGRSRLHREISYEEDSAISQTSSTSGYREGFADRHSFLMLESPPTPLKQFSPPLASPDIHDLPSTSSASQTAGESAVRHPLEQESSAESMNSGEDTALLPDASTPQPDSLSPPPHHPLLEPFDHHQDEDTLL